MYIKKSTFKNEYIYYLSHVTLDVLKKNDERTHSFSSL